MKKVIIVAALFASAGALADDRATASSFMKCARIANDAQRLACYDRLATELIELGLANMQNRAAAPAPSAPPPASPAAEPEPAAVVAAAASRAPDAVASTDPAPAPAPPQAADPAPAQAAVPTPAQTADPTPVPTTDPARERTAVAASPPAATVAAVAAPGPEPVSAAAPEPDPAARPADANEQGFGFERTDKGKDTELKEIRSRHVGAFSGWTGKTVFRLENGQVWQQVRSGRMVWRADSPMITIRRGFMGGYRLSVEGVNKQVYVKRIK